ncbi:hypothetical protein ACWC09_09195 [Streptomyces sp. NPDC001617]
MPLIDLEIGRYDWSGLRCGCGKSAVHLADDLMRLAGAQTREEASALRIDDHAMIQSFPQEPAVPVAAVLMAALAGDLSLGARTQCLELLAGLVFSDDDDSSERCQEIAREGLWTLYRDLWSNASPDLVYYAYYILRIIETDEERLHAYRSSGQIEIPGDFA